jgi:hypothetical protein
LTTQMLSTLFFGLSHQTKDDKVYLTMWRRIKDI